MARQDVVRALVPRERLAEVLSLLTDQLGAQPEHIEVEEAATETYRDEQPDRELRDLVRVGKRRVALGAVIGGLVGAVLSVVVPAVSDLVPWSTLLLGFGGAWAGGAVSAARGVQVAREDGPGGELLHEVDAEDRDQLRLVTVHDANDRPRIADGLADAGIVLLDSQHPKVGRRGEGRRPADRDSDGAGPPAP